MKRGEIIQQFFEAISGLQRRMAVIKADSDSPINRGQAVLLYLIWRNQPITVGDIAAKLGITSSAATQAVDGLVKRGILSREHEASDRRVVSVRLSDAGREEFRELRRQHLRHIERLMEPLSDQDLTTLVGLVQKIKSGKGE